MPAYLPGEHPFADEFARRHHLPEFAARGGPETMYPEFQARLREWLAKNPRPAAPEAGGRGGGRAGGAGGRGGGAGAQQGGRK
ncbi:hypothetical protein D3C83_114260 [compost metagenome]